MNGTRAFLLRHGATDWNRQGRTQGHSDIELNDEGIRQSQDAAQRLRDSGAVALYSSDLSRAMRTAEIVGDVLGLQVQKVPALREIDEGDWEGLTEQQIEMKWPDLWAARTSVQRPGGETPQEAVARALRFLVNAGQQHRGEAFVAVTHQSLVRWIYGRCSGKPDERCEDPRWPANAEIVAIGIDLEGSLTREPGDGGVATQIPRAADVVTPQELGDQAREPRNL